jgi:hypothetical protein
LQPYPIVVADALLEIGTAVISAVLSLDEHLSQTNTSWVTKFCYQLVNCRLIQYFLLRISIAKCFTNSNQRFRYEIMFENETRSTRDYTMFAPAQVLRNWREQRPSNKGDLDSSIAWEVGKVYYTGGVSASDLIFVP